MIKKKLILKSSYALRCRLIIDEHAEPSYDESSLRAYGCIVIQNHIVYSRIGPKFDCSVKRYGKLYLLSP